MGFSAEPGSWYTIEAAPERNLRSRSRDIVVMFSPSTMIVPLVIKPLRGRYRTAAYAVVDLPQPDSPTNP